MSVSPPVHDAGMRPRHRYVRRYGSTFCDECGQSPLAPIHGTPIQNVKPMTVLDFAEYVSQLSAVAHDLALRVPAFRSPPLDGKSERQITVDRYGAIVRVKMRGRPARETKRDMIDGLCEANNLYDTHPARRELLDRMEAT